MAHPNDQEFIELGIFECMAQLIWKGIEDRHWLAQDQNIYIPYYAAHIIGSYTMNMEEFAGQAVRAGTGFVVCFIIRSLTGVGFVEVYFYQACWISRRITCYQVKKLRST